MMTKEAGGGRRRGARGEDRIARRERGGFGNRHLRAGGAVRLQRLDHCRCAPPADPPSLTRALVSAIRAVDPEQPVLDIATLEEVVEESLGQRPLAMLLLAAFAVLALVLASVGHLQRAGLHGAPARARDRHPHGARRAGAAACCGWS